MPDLRLARSIELAETDGSRVMQRLGEVVGYTAAELVFAQTLAEWPSGRILRDSAPSPAPRSD